MVPSSSLSSATGDKGMPSNLSADQARTSSAPGSSHLGERGEPRFKDLQQGFAIAI